MSVQELIRERPSAVQAEKIRFRPDIQALRALAVGLVVFHHLWPTVLTGGFVGVDAFFVLSGYIISAQLIHELNGTGRIRIADFYARRVRRLLPAALLVLTSVVVAVHALASQDRWGDHARQVLASALYGQNWLLGAEPVDPYKVTAVAHFWSLSVEEQFYLVWPLLLLFLFKLRAPWARIAATTGLGLVSLLWCVRLTESDPAAAYFVTQVRVWEFAIGAVIALAGTRLALPKALSTAALLAGLALLVGSAVHYTGLTPYPGAAALLPTLGAGLIIVAGTAPGRRWHTAVTSSKPVQLLGDISYSLYLWHWPLLILMPLAVSGGVLDTPVRLGVLVTALVLAYLSKRFVEDPVRRWSVLTGSTRLTFAAMVLGLAVVGLAVAALL
ncbi:acyltransferase family protein [Streptomyces longispororuber]|uniref:acyltransferase family protein n=1 Tax=Streptomyces longispororuber TaxID=68230 RepID=UPI00210DA419|nr:acyltransferase [Streptomyces longispororuber]MCQ4212390.1 acyltransferase [Streptomyces longispororuber]